MYRKYRNTARPVSVKAIMITKRRIFKARQLFYFHMVEQMEGEEEADLAETSYLNNIGNIGIYFTKYRNFIGIFIKNTDACKVLKLCVQYKHSHC